MHMREYLLLLALQNSQPKLARADRNETAFIDAKLIVGIVGIITYFSADSSTVRRIFSALIVFERVSEIECS